MDYATGRVITDAIPRYWVWDFESDCTNHWLPLLEERIEYMLLDGEHFDPGEFVTWSKPWTIVRDWRQYS